MLKSGADIVRYGNSDVAGGVRWEGGHLWLSKGPHSSYSVFPKDSSSLSYTSSRQFEALHCEAERIAKWKTDFPSDVSGIAAEAKRHIIYHDPAIKNDHKVLHAVIANTIKWFLWWGYE